jgi:rare lipoprotein A
MPRRFHLKPRIIASSPAALFLPVLLVWTVAAQPIPSLRTGTASWYGEAHRGRLMANGQPFNPNELTAASWFYPLETRLRVIYKLPHQEPKSIVVTVTDRGPARRLVQHGRIVDLSRAAFEKLAPPVLGLIEVSVRPERYNEEDLVPAAILPWQTTLTQHRTHLFSAAQTSATGGTSTNTGVSAAEMKLP